MAAEKPNSGGGSVEGEARLERREVMVMVRPGAAGECRIGWSEVVEKLGVMVEKTLLTGVGEAESKCVILLEWAQEGASQLRKVVKRGAVEWFWYEGEFGVFSESVGMGGCGG